MNKTKIILQLVSIALYCAYMKSFVASLHMCNHTYAHHSSADSRENNDFDGIETVYVKEKVLSSSSCENEVS